MMATDRGGVFKRNIESQGTISKENPKPTSPSEKSSGQRMMKD
jgi:hypothetical protein